MNRLHFETTALTAPPKENSDRLLSLLLIVYGVAALLTIVLPVGVLIHRSLHNTNGIFVGLANYSNYFSTKTLFSSFFNSVFVAGMTSLIVIPLAFLYAYGLTRTRMRYKGFFRSMAFIPLLIPGILKAIALIYLFGNQGLFKEYLLGHSIYGPLGMITASVVWTFPHAALILLTAMLHADQRLYHAAEILFASKTRTFLTVTWPTCRYGVITAFLVVFISVFTDFGIAKVIGGDFNILATDIYKEVVGLQNFEMGAVISVVLMIPAIIVFGLERMVASRQTSQLSARSAPYQAKSSPGRDLFYFIFCALISLCILGILAMAQYAALIKFWPYNLSLTLQNYIFQIEGVGWSNFTNSLLLSILVASFGAGISFLGAYLVEKPRHDSTLRKALQMLMLLPMAIPGLVLGLAYLIFINQPGNPFGFLYGGMSILVISTVTHLYSVPHLTSLTALKGLDKEIESVGKSLKTSFWRLFSSVTIPVCLPALFDIWIYLFLRSMTTLSAVIFLYTSETMLASIAVIHIDETGRVASAAAMAMLIVYTCIAVRLVHYVVTTKVVNHSANWR